MKRQRLTFDEYLEVVRKLQVPFHVNRVRKFYDSGISPMAVFDIWCSEKRSMYPIQLN